LPAKLTLCEVPNYFAYFQRPTKLIALRCGIEPRLTVTLETLQH